MQDKAHRYEIELLIVGDSCIADGARLDSVESTKGAFGGVLPDYGVLTAGAMLAVDAALPACLLATIAAYAVVLLQIKFLS